MAAWFEDPSVLAGLNLPEGGITTRNLRDYIADFDNHRKFILGIFVKPHLRLIGFYQIDVNIPHRVAQLSAIIGDKDYRGLEDHNWLTDLLVDEFFTNRMVEKFVARVLANNYKALWSMKNSSFDFEAVLREDNLMPNGKRVDIVQFRRLKSGWTRSPSE